MESRKFISCFFVIVIIASLAFIVNSILLRISFQFKIERYLSGFNASTYKFPISFWPSTYFLRDASNKIPKAKQLVKTYPIVTENRTLDTEHFVKLNRTPLIVMWIEKSSFPLLGTFPKEFNEDYLNCSELYPNFNIKCDFKMDRSKASNADVLYIRLQDWVWQYGAVPNFQRPPGQLWVLHEEESPVHLYHWDWKMSSTKPKILPRLNNHINWTMTYRLDSDIPITYGQFELLDRPDFTQNYSRFGLKNSTSILISTYCDDRHSHRADYVVALLKYGLEIEHLGKCGFLQNNLAPFAKNPECSRQFFYGSSEKCNVLISQRYKFLLSFENSICADYITEKFYRAVTWDMIPVVLNGVDMSRIAPPRSYIDAKDFAGPQQLAEYLLEVGRNETLYDSYFWWKPYYRVYHLWEGLSYKKAYCRLCGYVHKFLNETQRLWPAHEDLEKWWVEQGQCKEGSKWAR